MAGFYRYEVVTFSRGNGGGRGRSSAAAAYQSGARVSHKSAVAAAAYRAAEMHVDFRTGENFDYTNRGSDVEHSEIMLPAGSPVWAHDRSALWNEVEKSERRKDSRVAREALISMPAEFTLEERILAAREMASWLIDRYGVAVDFALHRPDISWDAPEDEALNYHCHMMYTTRRLEGEQGFTAKTRELDDKAAGPKEIIEQRKAWERIGNAILQARGFEPSMDRRSLAARGIDREPEIPMGWEAANLEKEGIRTQLGDKIRQQREDRRSQIKTAAEMNFADVVEGKLKSIARSSAGGERAHQVLSQSRRAALQNQKTQTQRTIQLRYDADMAKAHTINNAIHKSEWAGMYRRHAQERKAVARPKGVIQKLAAPLTRLRQAFKAQDHKKSGLWGAFTKALDRNAARRSLLTKQMAEVKTLRGRQRLDLNNKQSQIRADKDKALRTLTSHHRARMAHLDYELQSQRTDLDIKSKLDSGADSPAPDIIEDQAARRVPEQDNEQVLHNEKERSDWRKHDLDHDLGPNIDDDFEP